ncbi:putative quinol monooxygenase [uncultured Hyphomonas sp.]|uniref:putative quinol monooxygenase n=1 Tax=uncultured Hyphomonas sp. TaxID=225298 RepID=UPI002AABE925|nr:putative quinol monooxygenase [uncultured Hyphomonas sp.]
MREQVADSVELVATLVARPGMETALVDAVLGIVPNVRKESGCISYIPHVVKDRPGTIVMYEVWADQASLDAHASGENLESLAAQFDVLLSEPLRLEVLRRIG